VLEVGSDCACAHTHKVADVTCVSLVILTGAEGLSDHSVFKPKLCMQCPPPIRYMSSESYPP
jgi:hypothetical protein